MTMQFINIKKSLIDNVLGPNENGEFQTIGFQRQGKSASEVEGKKRFVQLYASAGDFPRQRNSGPLQHDMSFNVELTVSAGATLDLNVINDPGSTTIQRAAALAAMSEASEIADDSWDELFSIVWNILMDATKYNVGLAKGTVASRWVQSWQKNDPVPMGELVVLTGSFQFTCRAAEQIGSDEGVKGDIQDTTVDIQDESESGVVVNPPEE